MTIEEKSRVVDEDWLKMQVFLNSMSEKERKAFKEMDSERRVSFLYDCIQYAMKNKKKYSKISFGDVLDYEKKERSG